MIFRLSCFSGVSYNKSLKSSWHLWITAVKSVCLSVSVGKITGIWLKPLDNGGIRAEK